MRRKNIFSIVLLSGVLLLASCGEAAAPTYTLTFHQTISGPYGDATLVVVPGETVQQDAWNAEPVINPKEGYSAVWGEYNVEELTSDLTIEPIYTINEYTATFIDRRTSETLGTTKFTIEDETLTNIPELPTLFGYTYAWEPYTIEAHDMRVYCDTTANVHTITFYADEEKTEQVGEPLTFTIETESLDEPTPPQKDGYDGYWPDYDLAADQDIEVVVKYRIHQYFVQFMIEGEACGEPLGYELGDTYADLEKPELPDRKGYTIVWPSDVTLSNAEFEDPQIISAIVTPNQYTVTYAGSGETTTVTYDRPYELVALSNESHVYMADGEIIAPSGDAWSIDHDIQVMETIDLPGYRALNFEDGYYGVFSIYDKFNSLEVVANEGIHGSKALKVSYTGSSAADCHLSIDKLYLDMIFADPAVKALSFFAKGTLATNNFRHKQVDASYVGGYTSIISCYEYNASGFGIEQNYKQFFLTRDVYSQMGASDWFIQYGVSGAADLYLDNFQVSYRDYFDTGLFGMEYGKLNQDGTRKFTIRHPASNQSWLQVVGSEDVSYDYSHGIEGSRALAAVRVPGVNTQFSINNDLLANVTDEGIVFDLYLTANFNGWWADQNTGGIVDGNNAPFVSKVNESVQASRWNTFHFTKSQMASDGTFLILKGSVQATIYIDNIRMADKTIKESFEDSPYISHFGDYWNVSHYEITSQTASNTMRDANLDYILIAEWNDCTNMEVTKEKASDGAYSLKMTFKKGGPIRFWAALYRLMDEESTFSFDIYNEDMTLVDSHLSSVEQGQWTTINMTKADYNAGASFRLFGDGWGASPGGTIYLDNICINL